MKILFKGLFFTLLVLKISSANAFNYLYTMSNGGKISVCKTTPSNDTHHIRECEEINLAYYDIQGIPRQIAISPNGAYAYIAVANRIYACLINNNSGFFEHCTFHKFSRKDYGGFIKGISGTNNRIYIQFFNMLTKSNKVVMCSSKMSECSDLNSNFLGIIKFIRISPDNKYAIY